MLNNNHTESEYIGWAVRSAGAPYFNRILEVTGWETISNRTRMKGITVRPSKMRTPHFYVGAPVIHVYSINENQTFSIVSKIFNDRVKKKLLHNIYILYNSLLISGRSWSTTQQEQYCFRNPCETTRRIRITCHLR